MGSGTERCPAGWSLPRRRRPLDNRRPSVRSPKIPPNHESAVNGGRRRRTTTRQRRHPRRTSGPGRHRRKRVAGDIARRSVGPGRRCRGSVHRGGAWGRRSSTLRRRPQRPRRGRTQRFQVAGEHRPPPRRRRRLRISARLPVRCGPASALRGRQRRIKVLLGRITAVVFSLSAA